MHKRNKLSTPRKITVHIDDYDDTVMLSLLIIVINLIMSILMYMD